MVIEWVAINFLPLPWSQSASVLSSIRQKPPGRYFLCYSSSRGSLVCWCRVTGLEGHNYIFLLSFALNSVPVEGRKERWCQGLRASVWQLLLSKSELLLRSGGEMTCWCQRFPLNLPTYVNTNPSWDRLCKNITQYDLRKEAQMQMFSGKEIIRIKSG